MPKKSPVLKKVNKLNDYGENQEDKEEEELEHDELNIAYSKKQRKDVFEIRVFNGSFNETQEEAVKKFKDTINEKDIFNVLASGIGDLYRDTPDDALDKLIKVSKTKWKI